MTGVGHARLINERFGRFWGWFSVGDLFLLNFLTITTEFIGVTLALAYFGVSKYVAVPIAAIVLVAIITSGSFRRWERAMFFFIATSLVLIPLAFLSHPSYSASVYHLLVPGVQGGSARTRSCSPWPPATPSGTCSGSSTRCTAASATPNRSTPAAQARRALQHGSASGPMTRRSGVFALRPTPRSAD